MRGSPGTGRLSLLARLHRRINHTACSGGLPVTVGAGLFTVLLAGFCSPGRGIEPDQSARAVRDPAPARPAASSTTVPPRSFTLVATGDVLLHSGLWDQAARTPRRRAGPASTSVPCCRRPPTAGERRGLTICHMETPVAPPGGPYSGYPASRCRRRSPRPSPPPVTTPAPPPPTTPTTAAPRASTGRSTRLTPPA